MTNIEWTNETWNPLVGCSFQSPGCTNCYAMNMAYRQQAMGTPQYAGTAKKTKAGPVWTGKVNFVESALLKPLSWKKPRLIFVNSMSDMFHPDVPFEWIDRIFAVMALSPQHTFQVLTKRSDRMREYMTGRILGNQAEYLENEIGLIAADNNLAGDGGETNKPLPNVWLGVSVEDQKRADERIPDLLQTPAAKRFLSCEPLLGSVDLERVLYKEDYYESGANHYIDVLRGGFWSPWGPGFRAGQDGEPKNHFTNHSDLKDCLIDWVIVGGESGKGARPMHPDWARTIRDQCAAANVPFFFKQWGSWWPCVDRDNDDPDWRADYNLAKKAKNLCLLNLEGGCGFHGDRVHIMQRRNKKFAGRLLDGQEHNGKPEVTA